MADATTDLNQYLTFTLGDELFAIDIGSVRELLDDKKITKIPRTPRYMRGVLNLRGRAVPVVDLRLKFGMAPTEMTVNTCGDQPRMTVCPDSMTRERPLRRLSNFSSIPLVSRPIRVLVTTPC
jgi:chemotaxis signal transduction protein